MANILEVDDLSMHYITKSSTVRAVEKVTFSIAEGETFGLVGESGCGKSTTARSLVRLLPEVGKIVGGSVRYKGQELTTMSDREIRGLRGKEIGMIFQDPMTSLNPVTTVRKQFFESLKREGLSKKEMEERAIELLRLVGIPEPANRMGNYVHEMSGGMRQRVMIAIALASQPRLLLADEPTTALDVTIQAQILDLLRRLRDEEGMSVVLISHDLGVVASLCDRVEVMYGGMALESGLVDDIFERPRHPYTSALLGAVPNPNERRTDRLVSIPGTPPSLVNPPDACPFADRCKFAADVCRTMGPEWRNYPSGQIARCAFDADALGLVGVGQGGEPCVCCGAKTGNVKDDESAKEA